ncbi:MAG: TonB-dependent siderophore receptor, partial [Pseudomonadota bacterium]
QQSLVDRIPIGPLELPFTLNILDRQFLDERNFTRPIEALTTLPNIIRTEDRQGTGTAAFLSRGFDAPILVDNRAQTSFRGSGARDDSFVERYEVLKGPASIANGPVGAGGIINTVTKIPGPEQFVDVELRGDQFGSIAAELDANLGSDATSDVLLFRLNAAYRDFEFDADETKRETKAIRPVAIANLGSSTTVRASVAYTEDKVNPNSGFPLLSTGGIPDEIDTDTFTGSENGEGKVEDLLYEAEVRHEFLDNLKLTVRGSKQKTDFDYQNTYGLYNYTPPPGLGPGDTTLFSYTQWAETESKSTFFDAQLAYQTDWFDQQQDFVVGYAYDKGSFDRLFSEYIATGPFQLAEIDQPRFGLSPSELGPVSPFTLFDTKLNSVLAEAAIRPTEWLTILGGIRYDELEQTTINFRRGNEFIDPYDDDETTMRLGVTVGVAEDINVYASFAQAFVPQFGLRRDNNPVDAERSDGYELGTKGLLWDGTVSFETGIFYTERENVPLPDPNNTPTEFFVVSAGEVEVKGFELSSSAQPLDGFTATFNLGYTDIEVTEGEDDVDTPVFPEWTSSLYLRYEFQGGPLQGFSAGGGYRYIGDRDGQLVDFDSYTIWDLNFGYQINDAWDVSLDILNVADEKYVENTTTNTVNRLTGGAVLGPPLTTVLTVRASFN